ncbi:hypothetical protein CKA32_001174 [Geitlerinema sp. FC II]|nr:hypothetical protein CKA32_001174 [Geitlerinema sp. FC II]
MSNGLSQLLLNTHKSWKFFQTICLENYFFIDFFVFRSSYNIFLKQQIFAPQFKFETRFLKCNKIKNGAVTKSRLQFKF